MTPEQLKAHAFRQVHFSVFPNHLSHQFDCFYIPHTLYLHILHQMQFSLKNQTVKGYDLYLYLSNHLSSDSARNNSYED